MSGDKLKILLVEDDVAFATLVQRVLEHHEFMKFHVRHVTMLEDAIRCIRETAYDAILLDLTLPDEYGYETFSRMKAVAVHTPIIILTAREGSELGLQAVREGAQDFISKDGKQLNSVARSLMYSIERNKAARHEIELAAAEERIRVITQFFQDLAHDLRTPITAVNNNVYLLRMLIANGGDQKKIEDRLDTLNKQVERLRHMTDNLFTLSQLDAGITASSKTIGQLSFAAALRDAAEALEYEAERKGQKIIIETDPEDISFFCDTVQFTRMIENLISNAISYTPEGGTIACRTYRKDRYGVIEISDTGKGIPTEKIPHIFDRLYRGDEARSTVGAGLGLSIVKRVAELHNGYVSVESEVGRGTSFYLHFPVA